MTDLPATTQITRALSSFSGQTGLLGFGEVADGATAHQHGDLWVDQCSVERYATMAEAFEDLTTRARWCNPAITPGVVAALAPFYPAGSIVPVVVTERACGRPDRMVGVWVFRRLRDVWSGGIEVLQAPIDRHYHSTAEPTVDAARAREVMAALLDYIARAPGLPRIIRTTALPVDTIAALPANRSATIQERWVRAMLEPAAPVAIEDYLKASMGKQYKKRQSSERALAREGAVTIETVRGLAVLAALDRFLALEVRGWKGKTGTAIIQQPDELARLRATFTALAARDQIAVDMILLDGAPVAIGLLPEINGQAFFWKTAYDEEYRRHAPGVLLDLVVTRRLFANSPLPRLDSWMQEFTDPDTQIWSERRDYARVLIAPHASLRAAWVRVADRARRAVREARNRGRDTVIRWRAALAQRRTAATTPANPPSTPDT